MAHKRKDATRTRSEEGSPTCLSRDAKTVRLDTDAICAICEKIDFLGFFAATNFQRYWTSRFRYTEPVEPGYLRHVFHCPACPFCRYVATVAGTKVGILNNADRCKWRVKQRPLSGSEYLRLSDIEPMSRLDICAYRTHEAPLLLATLDLCEGHMEPETANFRMVRRPLQERFELDLLRLWLATSEQELSQRLENQSITQNLPLQHLMDKAKFRVLDVNSGKVVVLRTLERYFALSYVWGQSTCDLESLISPLPEYCENIAWTINLDTAPATIKDAARVVRQLHERYLWIDAVCINQADTQDKAAIISCMDSIYRTAYLTIVAANGEDAYAGLRRLWKHSLYPERPVFVRVDGRPLSFLPAMPSYEKTIEQTTWNTRGWTYQEYMLSTKCLVFTEHEVFFSALGTFERESYVLKRRQSPLDILKKQKRRTGKMLSTRDALSRADNLHHLQFTHYRKAVQEYTRRSLRHSGDRLDAFSGFLNSFANRATFQSQEQALCGLLQAHKGSFGRCLHWQPVARSSNHCVRIRHNAAKTQGLPSWSWVGWLGEVEVQDVRSPCFLYPRALDRANIKVVNPPDQAQWPYEPQPCNLTPEEGVVLHLWAPVLRCKLTPVDSLTNESMENETYRRYYITLPFPSRTIYDQPQIIVDNEFALAAVEDTLHEFVALGSWEFGYVNPGMAFIWDGDFMLVQRQGNGEFVERIALSKRVYGLFGLKDEFKYEHVKLI